MCKAGTNGAMAWKEAHCFFGDIGVLESLESFGSVGDLDFTFHI